MPPSLRSIEDVLRAVTGVFGVTDPKTGKLLKLVRGPLKSLFFTFLSPDISLPPVCLTPEAFLDTFADVKVTLARTRIGPGMLLIDDVEVRQISVNSHAQHMKS